MTIDEDVEAWARSAPSALRGDVIWTAHVYRFSCFASEYIEADVAVLAKNQVTAKLAAQLYAAVGSIGANFAEGYSRSSAKDRSRIYDYALGSAREARQWVFKARAVLGEERTTYGMELLTKIIRMLITIIKNERAG